MKKLLLMLTAVLLLLSLCACGDDAADTDTDAGTDAANTADETKNDGDVADIPDDGIPRERVYRILSRSEIDGENVSDTKKYGYNKSGQLIYIREDGEADPFFTVEYDVDGNITEMLDTSGTLNKRWKFENGNLTSIATYLKRGTTVASEERFAYDEAGRVITQISYDSEGNINDQIDYKYDVDDGGNAAAKYTVYEGEEFLMWDAEYDDGGRMICEHFYNAGETASYMRCTYEYDELGNVTAKDTYGAYDEGNGIKMELSERIVCTYDSDGKLLTREYYYGGDGGGLALGVMEAYTYDEDGRLVLIECYSSLFNMVMTREMYEYDETGCPVSHKITSYVSDGSAVEMQNEKYTYREFYLTEDEIAKNETNDAIIRQYTSYFEVPSANAIG